VLASSALAAKPQTFPIDATVTTTVTDICSFPVTVTFTGVGTGHVFTDASGNVTSFQAHITETDTFSANGHTITGLPYHLFDVLRIDANGNVTETVQGVAERLRLPDGSLFLSAGRLHVPPDSEQGFSIGPDCGRTGDIGALCAALA
jgi:hypothetical protein